MDLIALKEYIARAKELEVAIYTQKKLMEEHRELLISKKPQNPIHIEIEMPKEPKYVQSNTSCSSVLWLGILGILLLICGFGTKIHWFTICGSVSLLGGLIGLCRKISVFKENNRRHDIFQYEYEKCQRKKIKTVQRYQHEHEVFERRMTEWLAEENEIIPYHQSILQNLQDIVQNHYNQNILFPKYRDLIAVTMIDEYLQSGRCDTLEGANGAYNLYEMELRQNIVVDTLSMILENMEQIRSNQYTLYEELSKANRTIDTIMSDLREMKSMEKLNTYFSAVTAKAAVSPKIVRGYIH